ncbi:methyltransferase [Roseovarius nitratireducens]|uniref:methyltransferase n=1 Tax=Roseovarius nitratireducens TaxID=2044597 RepID=UPI000CE267B8|nr:methyltransferase [Roseovarius nitratireducens]
MNETEIALAREAIESGNFSVLMQEQERLADSSTIGLIAQSEICDLISEGLEPGGPTSWITSETTWNSATFGPDRELSLQQRFLHSLWQVFSLRIARKLEHLQSKVRISSKGAVICFPGGYDLSVLVSFSAANSLGSAYLRPLVSIREPTGMLDLERFLENSTPKEKNAIKAAVTSVDKLVYHRGALIHVDRQRENVFGPTVDTVVLSEILNSDLRKNNDKSTSVLEIGPGSGLITVTAALSPATARVVSVEINEDAANCTLKNLQVNGLKPSSNHVSVSVRAEKFEPKLIGETFDYVVCNPPYVPEADSLEKLGATGYGKAISGLELYDDILSNFGYLLNSGGKVLLMMSSVSSDYALSRIPKGHEREFPLGLNGYRVPFDLDLLWDRPEWKESLLQKGAIEQDATGNLFHRIIPVWVRHDAN